MTNVAADSNDRRAHGIALVAAGAAIFAAVACSLLQLSEVATSVVATTAGAVPAAIGYFRSPQKSDKVKDLALLRKGTLSRPVPLVIVLLALAIFVWDSIVGAILVPFMPVDGFNLASLLGILLVVAGAFGISWYASHYLGDRPFRATIIAVIGMIGARVIVIIIVLSIAGASSLIPQYALGLLFHLLTLGAALAGVYLGRRRQSAFVAAKANRLAVTLGEDVGGPPSSDPPPPDSSTRRAA